MKKQLIYLVLVVLSFASTTKIHAASFEKVPVQVNEFKLEFFKEIYFWISRLVTDTSLTQVRFPKDECSASLELSQLHGPQHELHPIGQSCLDASAPASRFLRVKAEVPDINSTLSVKGQLELIASPLVRTDFPNALLTTETKSLAQTIISKIYYKEISTGLKDSLKRLKTDRLNGSDTEKVEKLRNQAELELNEQLTNLKKIFAVNKKDKSTLNLPIPELNLKEREFLTMFLSAFMWRARGGGLYLKDKSAMFATQKLRVRYVYNAYQTLVELNGWGQQKTEVGLSMMRRIISGWGNGHDLGTHDGDRAGDFKALAERGPYQTAGISELMKSHKIDSGPWDFSGTHLASCYVFGWDLMNIKNAQGKFRKRLIWGNDLFSRKPFAGITSGPATWAELCWGAAMGLGISKSLLDL